MNTTIKTTWSPTPPTDLGLYWYFGVLDKYLGYEPELHLISVTRCSGLPLFHSTEFDKGCTFAAPAGQWTPVAMPQLPA